MDTRVDPLVLEARAALRDEAPFSALLDLGRRLLARDHLGLARRVLCRALGRPGAPTSGHDRREAARLAAISTSRDPDLPMDARLTRALELLADGGDLADEHDPVMLGVAGGIYKRRWEMDGQRGHLEHALAFYQRGYAASHAGALDRGYTAVNVCYVLDRLAFEEERAGTGTHGGRRDRARAIREEVLGHLGVAPSHEWWWLATLTELCFGLGRFDEAEEWARRAGALPHVPDWEKESTSRQLVALAQVRPAPALDRVHAVLHGLIDDEEAVRASVSGKLGLALGGGGFRAVFFDIGVLARLAEADLLRRVEVLSCVSGGSIVGAWYYLELRKLLQDKPDAAITKGDYVAIVERIERGFLAAAQTDLRADPLLLLLTALSRIFPAFANTRRLGTLYEERLYSRVEDGNAGATRWLDDLVIRPAGERPDFDPKRHNWRRRAKVPSLVINASSLNTGHCWQFTPTGMGEAPGRVSSEFDPNELLERTDYSRVRVRLGDAVAASSAVPVFISPYSVEGVYPERTVLLVDGGAHDNLGVEALLGQECNVLLVSDASGQISAIERFPYPSLIPVAMRSWRVVQSRVRAAQLAELEARQRASLLRGVMVLHLRKGVPVPRIGGADALPDPDAPPDVGGPTAYGVDRHLQEQLARIRTDMDACTDLEGFALMTSGYLMAAHALDTQLPGWGEQVPFGDWHFRKVEAALRRDPGATGLTRRIERVASAAQSFFFKSARVDPWSTFSCLLPTLLLVAIAGWSTWLALALVPLALLPRDLRRVYLNAGALEPSRTGPRVPSGFWAMLVVLIAILGTMLTGCRPNGFVVGDGSPDRESVPAVVGDTADSVEVLPGNGDTASSEEPGDVEDVLFEEGAIHALSLTLDADARNSIRRNPSDYVTATLGYEDREWVVAIRVKGSSTYTEFTDKPSLVVDVNRVVPDQEFMGHKRFNLHNNVIDPSLMSEMMSYRYLRDAGLPASRVGYVRLTVDGDDYGLYTAVEALNDDFLESWFVNPDGNMYENGYQDCDLDSPRCFESEEVDEGTDDALYALSAAARADDWEEQLHTLLDWDMFIKSLAMDALIAHWDGYAYDRSNYHLYHDPVLDKWTFIPQSMDLDYGWRPWSYPTCGRYGVDPDDYTEGMLGAKCLASETCRAEYVAEVLVLNDAFEAADPVGRVDELYALIRDDVYSDDRKHYGDDDFEDHVACVRDWVAQRPDEIRAWAAGR